MKVMNVIEEISEIETLYNNITKFELNWINNKNLVVNSFCPCFRSLIG